MNDEAVFSTNLLASPCFRGSHNHQILAQRNCASATLAYNGAIDAAVNDLIVFCHQDMYFPEAWLGQIRDGLATLDSQDPNWGVVGCGGVTRKGEGRGHLYSSGLGVLGSEVKQPEEVETLDEIVLIFRKSSGLRFDSKLPNFHLYGTDICMRAAKQGMKSYVVSAFCIHNTTQGLVLPAEFYASCDHVRQVWYEMLPIQTTCIRLTKSNFPIYSRKLREFYLRYIRRKNEIVSKRVDNLQQLLATIDTGSVQSRLKDPRTSKSST